MIHRIVACTLSLALGAVIAPRAQAEGVVDAFDDFVAASVALSEALFYGAEFEEAEKFLQPERFEGSELVEEKHRVAPRVPGIASPYREESGETTDVESRSDLGQSVGPTHGRPGARGPLGLRGLPVHVGHGSPLQRGHRGGRSLLWRSVEGLQGARGRSWRRDGKGLAGLELPPASCTAVAPRSGPSI